MCRAWPWRHASSSLWPGRLSQLCRQFCRLYATHSDLLSSNPFHLTSRRLEPIISPLAKFELCPPAKLFLLRHHELSCSRQRVFLICLAKLQMPWRRFMMSSRMLVPRWWGTGLLRDTSTLNQRSVDTHLTTWISFPFQRGDSRSIACRAVLKLYPSISHPSTIWVLVCRPLLTMLPSAACLWMRTMKTTRHWKESRHGLGSWRGRWACNALFCARSAFALDSLCISQSILYAFLNSSLDHWSLRRLSIAPLRSKHL